MAYASGTEVSVERSKEQLKKLIYKHGGTNLKLGEEEHRAIVMFMRSNRLVRFVIEFPRLESREIAFTPTGLPRSKDVAYKAYEAEQRRRWRVLFLGVKALFEAAEIGLFVFEQLFLSFIVLPNGTTVFESSQKQIGEMYESGVTIPPLLLE